MLGLYMSKYSVPQHQHPNWYISKYKVISDSYSVRNAVICFFSLPIFSQLDINISTSVSDLLLFPKCLWVNVWQLVYSFLFNWHEVKLENVSINAIFFIFYFLMTPLTVWSEICKAQRHVINCLVLFYINAPFFHMWNPDVLYHWMTRAGKPPYELVKSN